MHTNMIAIHATGKQQGTRDMQSFATINQLLAARCNLREMIRHLGRRQRSVTLKGTWEANESWWRAFSGTKWRPVDIFTLVAPWRPALASRPPWRSNSLPSLLSPLWWRNRRGEASLSDSRPAPSWWLETFRCLWTRQSARNTRGVVLERLLQIGFSW